MKKEKKRLEWRKGFFNEIKRITNKTDFDFDTFIDSSYYSNLQVYLSKPLRKEINRKPKRYVPGKRRTLNEDSKVVGQEIRLRTLLLNEIAVLEKKWGLL